MPSEELGKFDRVLSDKFNRKLQEWGSDIPDIPIDDFLRQNKKILGLKEEANGYWKDKKLRNYCFDVVQAKNNGNNNGNNGYKEIDPKRKNELYEALVKYTAQKETEFREKENKHEGSRDKLKSEREEILRFVRAREALKIDKVIDYDKAAKEQKIRDAKLVTNLTRKAA